MGLSTPRASLGPLGGVFSPVPPISLPENFSSCSVSVGGALAAVPLVVYLHPVGLIIANYPIMRVKRSRSCWGGCEVGYWGAEARVMQLGGAAPPQ